MSIQEIRICSVIKTPIKLIQSFFLSDTLKPQINKGFQVNSKKEDNVMLSSLSHHQN